MVTFINEKDRRESRDFLIKTTCDVMGLTIGESTLRVDGLLDSGLLDWQPHTERAAQMAIDTFLSIPSSAYSSCPIALIATKIKAEINKKTGN